jgi:hypothetical protein
MPRFLANPIYTNPYLKLGCVIYYQRDARWTFLRGTSIPICSLGALVLFQELRAVLALNLALLDDLLLLELVAAGSVLLPG